MREALPLRRDFDVRAKLPGSQACRSAMLSFAFDGFGMEIDVEHRSPKPDDVIKVGTARPEPGPRLLAMWLPVVCRLRLGYSKHQQLRDVYPEHLKIAAAFKKGNRKTATKALEANIV